MTHRMIFNQTGHFGRGAISAIPAEITSRGLTRAFVVTDPVLAGNGTAARVTDLLDAADLSPHPRTSRKLGPPNTTRTPQTTSNSTTQPRSGQSGPPRPDHAYPSMARSWTT